MKAGTRHRDAIVIGSGFGGSMAAWALVHAGRDVLMLERGPWVTRGPHNWGPQGSLITSPYYDGGGECRAVTDAGEQPAASCSCVGGASVFYGGVSLRYREDDFLPDPEIVTDSGARWPIGYADLAPFYDRVERILHVAGVRGADPIEPDRSGEYPAPPAELSAVAKGIAEGGRKLGLRPFPLPLAINFNGSGTGRQSTCRRCTTCDTYPCAIRAKNDLATRVLPALQARGLMLLPEVVATRLQVDGSRVVAVEVVDRRSRERATLTADVFVLAAGALASPHLLLASRLAERNPAGELVGRYLTRHCAGIVYGVYPRRRPIGTEFHKQVGFHDFYFGDPNGDGPPGKLGNVQQTQTPSMELAGTGIARPLHPLARPLIERATGLLVMAEDRPRYGNHVSVDPTARDEFGMPGLVIRHSYDDRDIAARSWLMNRATQIHRAAGALLRYIHEIDTFSHALGTVRMGDDPSRNPLDAECRFRGVDNLYVVDGSALPSSAGVNPSLTIAANALRAGERIAARMAPQVRAHGTAGSRS